MTNDEESCNSQRPCLPDPSDQRFSDAEDPFALPADDGER